MLDRRTPCDTRTRCARFSLAAVVPPLWPSCRTSPAADTWAGTTVRCLPPLRSCRLLLEATHGRPFPKDGDLALGGPTDTRVSAVGAVVHGCPGCTCGSRNSHDWRRNQR